MTEATSQKEEQFALPSQCTIETIEAATELLKEREIADMNASLMAKDKL